MPLPVRLVVKEQAFIDWIVSHQDKVIDIVKSQMGFADDVSVERNASAYDIHAESPETFDEQSNPG
ncbi:MAG: hypothetical protein ACK55E_10890 [Cyanobacteriota bacterium]